MFDTTIFYTTFFILSTLFEKIFVRTFFDFARGTCPPKQKKEPPKIGREDVTIWSGFLISTSYAYQDLLKKIISIQLDCCKVNFEYFRFAVQRILHY